MWIDIDTTLLPYPGTNPYCVSEHSLNGIFFFREGVDNFEIEHKLCNFFDVVYPLNCHVCGYRGCMYDVDYCNPKLCSL